MYPVSNITETTSRLRLYFAQQGRFRVVVLGIAAVVLAAGAGLTIAALYTRHSTEAYDAAMLAALWNSYKQRSWDKITGRSFDAQNNNVTTSEGQAYTMLRAVWSNDHPTFDRTWQWTATNLQRSDRLFSWRYGMLPNGMPGILTSEGGQNTASDADVDIATALLLAAGKWHNPQYHNAAAAIIPAIWDQEVMSVQRRLYLAADNLEKPATTPFFVMNPSYLSPYAFRLFSKLDAQHDWIGLANDSYTFLQQVDTAPLGGSTAAGLPPDWVAVDRHTGAVQAPTASTQTTDFGYNAFRVLWRIGLDWQWFHPQAALQTYKSYQLLNNYWSQHHKLMAVYHHTGQPAVDYESLALYGGVLGYFKVTNSSIADDIVSSKLKPLYDQAQNNLASPLSYYDNNWVWFGMALYGNKLPNLSGYGGQA